MSDPRPAGKHDPAFCTPDQELWQLWQQGELPDVGRFLAEAGNLSLAQVPRYWRSISANTGSGASASPRNPISSSIPALQTDVETALELIYGEYLLREEFGERPAREEYLQRFPQYAERLRQQLDLHRALGSNRLGQKEESADQETMLSDVGRRCGRRLNRPGTPQPSIAIQRRALLWHSGNCRMSLAATDPAADRPKRYGHGFTTPTIRSSIAMWRLKVPRFESEAKQPQY